MWAEMNNGREFQNNLNYRYTSVDNTTAVTFYSNQFQWLLNRKAMLWRCF